MRNKLMLGGGAVAVVSGTAVVAASSNAGATAIILNPIVAPILHVLAVILL